MDSLAGDEGPSGPTSRRTMAAISSTVPKRLRGSGGLPPAAVPPGAARGVDGAGRERVAGDLVRRQLDGQRRAPGLRAPPSRPRRGSGWACRHAWRRRTWPRRRRRRAPPSAARSPGQAESPVERHRQDLAPFLERHVEEGRLAAKTGVAHQYVDAAEFCAASAASRGATAGSETSPIAAMALPPAASISRTTASTAALSARPLTTRPRRRPPG